MADIRNDFSRTAQDLSRVAQDAAYVAVGLGVVGFQRAQVARRELMEQLERQAKAADRPLGDFRTHFSRAYKELDAALGQLITAADTTFEPVAELLPEPVQQVVKQTREARDQVRSFLKDQIAA